MLSKPDGYFENSQNSQNEPTENDSEDELEIHDRRTEKFAGIEEAEPCLTTERDADENIGPGLRKTDEILYTPPFISKFSKISRNAKLFKIVLKQAESTTWRDLKKRTFLFCNIMMYNLVYSHLRGLHTDTS